MRPHPVLPLRGEGTYLSTMYSKSIQQLITAFCRLPSVGERTAERFVFYLLKSGKKPVGELTLALKGLMDNIKSCEECWNFSDQSPCVICADKVRDHNTICIVAEPQDIIPFEKTGMFHGVYHVLRGVIKPESDNRTALKVNNLLTRLKGSLVKEIILAFNPDLNGENTMMYLQNEIKKNFTDIKITRLARGLPMGSDLQYADEITLGSALKNRN